MKIRNFILEEDRCYHIFNRGINGQNIFFEEKNYIFFLEKVKKYLIPYFEIYAYCLMNNHFHLLVQPLPNDQSSRQEKGLHSHRNFHSKQIGKLISSYTQAFNKIYNRHGPLLESPFKRLEVSEMRYLLQLIIYIHNNPKEIGIMPEEYEYCSYSKIISNEHSWLNKSSIEWFSGVDNFIYCHKNNVSINWFE